MDTSQPDDGLKGLRPIENHPPIGVMPNRAHQDALGFMSADNYRLAVVEFDDQGRCYDRAQLDQVSVAIEQMRESLEDAIVLVFVHGWKHDARSDDENLSSFRRILSKTARHEQECSGAGKPRDVYGVFVGWRGLSAYDPSGIVADVTIWRRQAAAHRIATGSVRELFGRLRHYRNSRLKHGGSPLLAICGHSLGGMVVISALAQSLVEAASAPATHIIPGFADLVLLANPAIEGARYLPIYDLVSSDAFKSRTGEQLPVFICVQALNDRAVRTWFPIGNAANGIGEASIGALEKRCVTHAIGFIDQFRTHRISGPADGKPFVLDPPQMMQKDPFWIVAASKEVVDGHGGIWQDSFMCFLAAVLFQHVAQSRAPAATAPGPVPLATAIAGKAAKWSSAGSRNLADFAARLGCRS